MAGNPNPACASTHPMSRDPNSRGTGRSDPRARRPNITCPIPSPVTGRPNVTRARGDGLRFYSHDWRSLRDDYFAGHNSSGRNSGRHFLSCSRRSRRNRRLFGAAKQCEWQCQHPNVCSHSTPFSIISFLVRRFGLISNSPNALRRRYPNRKSGRHHAPRA